ncbi:diaminopimelate epimerase [Chloroflexota bacterium]
MNFTKMQGTGNDFIVIEPGGLKRNWKKLAIAMCDRHFGIGGDGLILVQPSKKADFRMRILNADGSEAEMCGNGIRCMTVYLYYKELASRKNREVRIETLAGIKMVRPLKSRNRVTGARVGMGIPQFNAVKIPVSLPKSDRNELDIIPALCAIEVKGRGLLLHFVSMGNPHAVHFIEQSISDFPLAELGSEIENNDLFPRRINFEVARIIDRNNIEIAVWERGSGITLACGTGACAVVVISRLLGFTDETVNVFVPGGKLCVEWDRKGEVFLSGPAEVVFEGDWPD